MSDGVCKLCGKSKKFPNSVSYNWDHGIVIPPREIT